jgi:hypothetical protein
MAGLFFEIAAGLHCSEVAPKKFSLDAAIYKDFASSSQEGPCFADEDSLQWRLPTCS